MYEVLQSTLVDCRTSYIVVLNVKVDIYSVVLGCVQSSSRAPFNMSIQNRVYVRPLGVTIRVRCMYASHVVSAHGGHSTVNALRQRPCALLCVKSATTQTELAVPRSIPFPTIGHGQSPIAPMHSWRTNRADARRVRLGLALVLALCVAAYLTRGLVLQEDTEKRVVAPEMPMSPETRAEAKRCERVRQRIATSLADYVQRIAPNDENLQELMKPLFHERHLVIWSSQANAGPLLDLRSLLEPLGVDFIEHTLEPSCRQLCDCSAPSPAIAEATPYLVHPSYEPYGNERAQKVAAFRTALARLSNFSRIDAFFSAYP